MSKTRFNWASAKGAGALRALSLLCASSCRTDFAVPEPGSTDGPPTDVAPRNDTVPIGPDATIDRRDAAATSASPAGDGGPSSIDAYVPPPLPAAGPLRGLFRLATQSTGDCWDLAGGARVLRSPCDPVADQLFELIPLMDTYRIVSARTGQCLRPAASQDGSALVAGACSADPQQRFRVQRSVEDRFVLRTNQPNQCLDAVSTPGANALRTWPCNESAAQDWELRRQFAGGDYQLAIKYSGKCLDVPNASAGDGVLLQQMSCNGGAAQRFTLVERGPNVFQIVNRSTGKCVDVRFSGLIDGIPLHQWGCNGTTAQFFRIESVQEHDRLVNINSGRCIQVAGSPMLDGQIIEQGACSNSDLQLWRMTVVPEPGEGSNSGPCGNGICEAGENRESCAADCPAASVIVIPQADVHVREGIYAGDNYGGEPNLLVKSYVGTLGNARIAFLRFSLGGVAAKVPSAKLRVYANAVPIAKYVGVYAVSDITWGESTMSWNTQPAIGLKQGSSRIVGATGAWHEFDVSSYVQAQRNANATAVSFALKQDIPNDDTPTSFDSKDGTNKPELVIQPP